MKQTSMTLIQSTAFFGAGNRLVAACMNPCAGRPAAGATCLIAMTMLLLLSPVPARAAPALFQGELVTYQRMENGVNRVFDFDGNTPFVNPLTGQSDIAALGFDGGGIESMKITNAGSGTGHIAKVIDPVIGQQVTRMRLLPTDRGEGGYRTQINAHHVEPYRTFSFDFEFKLELDWDFSMRPGAGLLWQLKGSPKDGQWGNPSLALNLDGNQLALSIKYPRSAMSATSWPIAVRWANGEYMDVSIPTRTIVPGQYHRILIMFFADERPPAAGGRGWLQAWFDGQPWARYEGPTLHPDQKGPHRIDFGWYQWEGKPSAVRTVYFKTAHLHQLR